MGPFPAGEKKKSRKARNQVTQEQKEKSPQEDRKNSYRKKPTGQEGKAGSFTLGSSLLGGVGGSLQEYRSTGRFVRGGTLADSYYAYWPEGVLCVLVRTYPDGRTMRTGQKYYAYQPDRTRTGVLCRASPKGLCPSYHSWRVAGYYAEAVPSYRMK
jgi:hypothetical protein